MKSITAACSYLNLWKRSAHHRPHAAVLHGACYFPLAGLILGAMLVAIHQGLQDYLDPEILSMILVAALIIATRAFHITGLQKTVDSIAVQSGGATNTDSSAAAGIVAILLILLFKVKSIEILQDNSVFGLLLTPLLARWALVVFIYGSYRFSEGEAREIAQRISFTHLLLTSIVTLTLSTYLLGPTALWIGVYLSLFVLICRTIFHRCNGALTTNSFGAIIELGEALSLTVLASF